MKHNRTRYSLGHGGLVYIVTTGLILGAAIYTQANLLFWGFGLMIGGLIVSLLLTIQTMRKIEVRRLLPAHGVVREHLAVRYHVTNRSWLPVFSMTISENWGRGRSGWKRSGPIAESPYRLRGRPYGWVMHIGPQQSIQAEAPCWPARRGPLRFERIVVATSFPFGMVRKLVEFDQSAELVVYPRLFRMTRRLITSLSEMDVSGRKHVERAGGTEEFFGLREYRVGDSLKMVDWKRTARTGEMVAREMTQPTPPRMMVLLDLTRTAEAVEAGAGRPEPEPAGRRRRAHRRRREDLRSPAARAEDRAISLTASLICDAYFHGCQIGLAVIGAACPVFSVHHSLPHRTRMLEALARLDTSTPTTARPDVTPSVVIWPGNGRWDAKTARARVVTLGAADMDEYIVNPRSETSTLLSRRVLPASRRDEVAQLPLTG